MSRKALNTREHSVTHRCNMDASWCRSPNRSSQLSNLTALQATTIKWKCLLTATTLSRFRLRHGSTLASPMTISGTFNPLSKVLFTFPSWYLCSIGFGKIFSFRWNLPPIFTLYSQRARLVTGYAVRASRSVDGTFTLYGLPFQRSSTSQCTGLPLATFQGGYP